MTAFTARCPPVQYVRLNAKKKTEYKQDETEYT